MKTNFDLSGKRLQVPAFGDLKVGDCFTFISGSDLYIKIFPYTITDGAIIACVRVRDGSVFSMNDAAEICPRPRAVVFANGDPR